MSSDRLAAQNIPGIMKVDRAAATHTLFRAHDGPANKPLDEGVINELRNDPNAGHLVHRLVATVDARNQEIRELKKSAHCITHRRP